METISEIITDMREFADADSQSIGRDVLRRRIQHFADSIEQAVTNCNQFKMRSALEYLRDASREFCHLILNSKYNEVYDKYKHPEVAKISDAIVNANIALAASPRNCDLYETENETLKAFHATYPISTYYLYVKWLFAEAKGDAK